MSEEEWDIIKKRHLLTDEEVERINEYDGYMPLLPLVWAMVEVESAVLGAKFDEFPTRCLLKVAARNGT